MGTIIHVCFAPTVAAPETWPRDIAAAFDAGVAAHERLQGNHRDARRWAHGQSPTISAIHAPQRIRGDALLLSWWREGYWRGYGSQCMATQRDVDAWIKAVTPDAIARVNRDDEKGGAE